MADPPEEQKLNVLNEVWKAVVKLKNPGVSPMLSSFDLTSVIWFIINQLINQPVYLTTYFKDKFLDIFP